MRKTTKPLSQIFWIEYMNDESFYSIHLFLSIDSIVALNN